MSKPILIFLFIFKKFWLGKPTWFSARRPQKPGVLDFSGISDKINLRGAYKNNKRRRSPVQIGVRRLIMATKIEVFLKPFLKENLPDVRPGDIVRVYQKIQEKDKERVQPFEGIVIARKHGKEIGATITVRREISGIGVERIFPLHSPTIEKIEILKRRKVRRAKLYYLRKAKRKSEIEK